MTKMQIIAKAVITFLGLSAAVNLCRNPSLITSANQEATPLQITLFLPVFIILLIAVVYFLILKNDWLVYKIAGPGEKLSSESESEILWLTASLRIVAIAYGLILFNGSISAIINLLASVRYKSLFPWSYTIYNSLITILAIYLLCGWPQFIRYQLNLRKLKSCLDRN